jgi:hypothetical protein
VSKEQKEFFYNVLKNEQKVYSSLVKKVFFDALSSAYPLFYKEVDNKKFEKIVCKFMQYGAKNVKMWKMPNEFRLFIKKKKLFREIVYVDDLLWFEWSEVNLMMKNYKTQIAQKFSYKNEYKLSKSCVIKKLKYRVFEKDNFSKKGKFYLLAYYDMSEYRVLYVELSQIMHLFLKNMKKNGMKYSLNKIAKMSEQSKKEVKEFLENSLKELLIKGVIKI